MTNRISVGLVRTRDRVVDGFPFVAEALFRTYIPAVPWSPVITNLGYSLGFLIVIVGRQQLFTENTLTAIIPLLARRNLATL